jgi:hypothetical protein
VSDDQNLKNLADAGSLESALAGIDSHLEREAAWREQTGQTREEDVFAQPAEEAPAPEDTAAQDRFALARGIASQYGLDPDAISDQLDYLEDSGLPADQRILKATRIEALETLAANEEFEEAAKLAAGDPEMLGVITDMVGEEFDAWSVRNQMESAAANDADIREAISESGLSPAGLQILDGLIQSAGLNPAVHGKAEITELISKAQAAQAKVEAVEQRDAMWSVFDEGVAQSPYKMGSDSYKDVFTGEWVTPNRDAEYLAQRQADLAALGESMLTGKTSFADEANAAIDAELARSGGESEWARMERLAAQREAEQRAREARGR